MSAGPKNSASVLLTSRRAGASVSIPSLSARIPYHLRLCLVQVATPERLILIDPVTVGPLDAFWKLVVDPANLVIVHAGREEVRLCRLWTGQTPGNLFDLQIAAGLAGMNYPLGHGTLVSQLLKRSWPRVRR